MMPEMCSAVQRHRNRAHAPRSCAAAVPPTPSPSANLQVQAALARAQPLVSIPASSVSRRQWSTAACRSRRVQGGLAARASLTYKEASSGIEFPLVQKLWLGDEMRCVGAGCRYWQPGSLVAGTPCLLTPSAALCPCPPPASPPSVVAAPRRSKKVAFIGVKVYAVALYVEAEKMARELGVRNRWVPACRAGARRAGTAAVHRPPQREPPALRPHLQARPAAPCTSLHHPTLHALHRRGGFFEGDDDFCQALVDGGCVKALQLELARDVEGAQFVEALEEALAPRMRLAGGERAAAAGLPGGRRAPGGWAEACAGVEAAPRCMTDWDAPGRHTGPYSLR